MMMRIYILSIFMLGIVVFLFLSVEQGFAPPPGNLGEVNCPVKMAPVGPWCVDEFEASVWSRPPKNNGDPQGEQFGADGDDYICPDNGNACADTAPFPIYAASVPGVTPSRYITWFQAQQACANVGKQLLPNAIWQMAAAAFRIEAPEVCNIDTSSVENTGSRTGCVSNWGVSDMVGNVWEWVEDWIQDNSDIDAVDTSTLVYGVDQISGVDEASPATDGFPAALIRGGSAYSDTGAGVFALSALSAPSDSAFNIGFRCGRPR